MGNDVVKAVQSFFDISYMLKELNSTNIALFPKVNNSKCIFQYRPISLSNFIYQIIPRVMANKLKKWIHLLVFEQQSAFTPKRSIQDNIIISHKAFHGLKTSKHKKTFHMA